MSSPQLMMAARAEQQTLITSCVLYLCFSQTTKIPSSTVRGGAGREGTITGQQETHCALSGPVCRVFRPIGISGTPSRDPLTARPPPGAPAKVGAPPVRSAPSAQRLLKGPAEQPPTPVSPPPPGYMYLLAFGT